MLCSCLQGQKIVVQRYLLRLLSKQPRNKAKHSQRSHIAWLVCCAAVLHSR